MLVMRKFVLIVRITKSSRMGVQKVKNNNIYANLVANDFWFTTLIMPAIKE